MKAHSCLHQGSLYTNLAVEIELEVGVSVSSSPVKFPLYCWSGIKGTSKCAREAGPIALSVGFLSHAAISSSHLRPFSFYERRPIVELSRELNAH